MIETPDEMLTRYPVIEIRDKPAVRKRQRRKSVSSVDSGKSVASKYSDQPLSTVYSQSSYQPISVATPENSKSVFIVFVAGGLTYGEIKMATLLNDVYSGFTDVGVVFGSTQIFSPDDFIEKLHALNTDEPTIRDQEDNFVSIDCQYYSNSKRNSTRHSRSNSRISKQ